MRKILIAFGVLDLIGAIFFLTGMPTILDRIGQVNWYAVIILTIIILIIASGLFSVLQKKTAFYFCYFLFPIRLVLSMFTLGFVPMLLRDLNSPLYKWVFGGIVFMEVARLLFTIYLHKSYIKVSAERSSLVSQNAE